MTKKKETQSPPEPKSIEAPEGVDRFVCVYSVVDAEYYSLLSKHVARDGFWYQVVAVMSHIHGVAVEFVRVQS